MIAPPVRWSPSRLVDYLACRHLVTLERAALAGGIDRPPPSDEERLIAETGRAHEDAVLGTLRERRTLVEIGAGDRATQATQTIAAMRAGAAAISGGVFIGGDGFVGVVDLLERVESPSAFGGWSYEVVDVKLAAAAKPSAIVQACSYAERVAAVQEAPVEYVHLILGDGRRETYRTSDGAAYVRAAEARFRSDLATWPVTAPVKNAHCERCRWDDRCSAERRAADDVADVAGIRANHLRALHAAGITTLSGLADAPDAVRGIAPERLAMLRRQAGLQRDARRTGVHAYVFREPTAGAGFARLPAPDAADVWFDMEGDPLVAGGGLEYLFGATMRDGSGTAYRAWWAHDRLEERAQFADFVDFLTERRRASPGMHVYHYAPYEPSALVRLAGRHAVREDDVDALLRDGVFVDLYAVVRGALQLSTDDLSIKRVETFYRQHRDGDVTTSMGSVVAYERWKRSGDATVLQAIERYNQDDCDSTFALDGWLRDRFAEARDHFGADAWAPAEKAEQREISPERAAEDAAVLALSAALVGDDSSDERRQLGHAVNYHRREARPAWREYYERRDADADELIELREALGGLVAADEPSVADGPSLIHVLAAPPQESTLQAGPKRRYTDPATGRSVILHGYDATSGRVTIKRHKNRIEPLPAALIEGPPIGYDPLKAALTDLARAALAGGPRYAAARAIAARAAPRRSDGRAFRIEHTSPAALAECVRALDGSYLVVQGPPGTGKTYTGARAIVDLIAGGKTVAVTSRSHRAIHHLLHEIEIAARSAGVRFSGAVRDRDEEEYVSASGAIAGGDVDLAAALAGGMQLVAGTAWALSTPAMREAVDVVAIDEAGQLSLADALAIATCARSVVLLGDPCQLPHVAAGTHPEGTGVSVLHHLLRGARTVSPERGAFLATTFRMHPDVASFISELMYDGRLTTAPVAANRTLAAAGRWSGAGLRTLAVEHTGNGRSSNEEAAAIAEAVCDVLGASYDDDGTLRPIVPGDVLVVAPYNLQVRAIRAALDARGCYDVRAGTVDKFQGQEAAVVFFSMTSSSGDDVPRGLAFLFSRERLNVAISRARTLAVLVYAPALLTTRVRTLDDIGLVSAVARFVEMSTPLPAAAERKIVG